MGHRLTTCHNREIAKFPIAPTKNPYFIVRGIARKGSNQARSVEVGGAVVEDVTQMAAAATAMTFGPKHEQGPIRLGADGIRLRLPEAGPAGAAVVFVLGRVEREIELSEQPVTLVSQLRHFAPDLSLSGRCRGQ